MAADVPEVALAKLTKQGDWVAPRVACGIPCGRLAAVFSEVGRADTTVYGLVKRQQVLQEEGDHPDGFITNLWLVRLARALDGSYHWEDFIPACKHCKEQMRPIMSRVTQPECPLCKGTKGKGKCFQFDCPEYNEASVGCGQVEAASRPVYCGSHPFFSGYAVKDEYFGNSSCPLFQYEVASDDCEEFSLVANLFDGLQVDIFTGLFQQPSMRVRVDEYKQSIVSPTEVRKCSGSSSVSSATPVGWHLDYVEGRHIHYVYIMVQRDGHQPSILRSVETKPTQWLDCAPMQVDEACYNFRKQIVVMSKGRFGQPTRVAGLSRDGLWVMDVPSIHRLEDPKTASSLARKLSWKRVLTFTDVPKLAEDEEEDFDSPPQRLLALGPKSGQVVIFTADEACKSSIIRPRLLVEISDSLTDSVKTVDLTSIVGVPEVSPDLSEKALSCDLLPSVVRVSGQPGGYFLFNQLGQVYHVRDEGIILAQAAWRAPDFTWGSIKNPVVTFNVRDAEKGSVARLCIASVLERYEYFQKLLGQWQEGASAEVTITDISLDVFDHFLTYIHSGTVGGQLELDVLVQLVSLANKYLMQDLVASCLLPILSILQDGDRMKRQEQGALADMLALSDKASACFPTMMRKLIDAVLHHRGELIKDAVFLEHLARSSAKALSLLLAPLAPRDDSDGRYGMRKRRKTVLDMQSAVWHGESEASDTTAWC